MSVTSQRMIAALGGIRTAPAVFAGFQPELKNVTPSQWVTWKLGWTAATGTTFRVVLERLCEALQLETGERALNVTAGNGYVPLAAAEKLPFRDAAFDVVTSGFGAMFAPDHHRIACELLRVCRRGGRIGLAAWTPQGFAGELMSVIDKYSTTQIEADKPADWGSREYLSKLFGHSADALGATTRTHTWRYRSPEHWLAAWQSHGGPLCSIYKTVDPDWREQFTTELLATARRFNEATDGTMVVRSEYLEFLVHKSTWRI